MKICRTLLVVVAILAILLAALWFAGERRLVAFPYPPIQPWLSEYVTITVFKSPQGQCVVVDLPSRVITKAGRTVTWKIRARKDECADHEVILQFEGDDPTGNEKKGNAADRLEIKATINPAAKQEKLYIYQILLASQQPVVMARGTLAACPYWPCNAAKVNAADATLTTAPGTTIPASPAPAGTPRPNP